MLYPLIQCHVHATMCTWSGPGPKVGENVGGGWGVWEPFGLVAPFGVLFTNADVMYRSKNKNKNKNKNKLCSMTCGGIPQVEQH